MMRPIILVGAMIALALGAEVCFPNQFKTDQATYDPANGDMFGSRLWFDYYAEKMRLDVNVEIIDNNVTDNRLSIIADYTKQKLYHIMYTGTTGNCTVYALNEPLSRLCLSKKAEHRGTVLLGGVLKTENYIERDQNKGVALDILFIDNINIPVRSLHRRQDGTTTIDEFWNFEEKTHHDAFVIPNICQSHEIVDEITSPFKTLVPNVSHMRHL